jgi:hypothetical protein
MDLREKTANTNRHPWELSRADCILNIVKKYRLSAACDIGAGDRFFTSKLLPFVEGAVYAVDTEYAENAVVIDGIDCRNDISAIPELMGGGIIMMDVLEHIKNDNSFLTSVLRKISRGGLVFVTVPAFQSLFSGHDIFLKHYRRYNRKQLLALLCAQGLRVESCHYFYASLFLARFAQLIMQKKKSAVKHKGIGEWRFSEKHIITRMIRATLTIDFYCCAFFAKLRIYLPGLSLLAVCRKEGTADV